MCNLINKRILFRINTIESSCNNRNSNVVTLPRHLWHGLPSTPPPLPPFQIPHHIPHLAFRYDAVHVLLPMVVALDERGIVALAISWF